MTDTPASMADRLRRIRDRHFDCFAHLAKAAVEEPDDEDWPEVFDAELANIRNALEWGLATSRRETAVFATSLLWYWQARRLYNEGTQVLERVLRNPVLSAVERIDALLAAGLLVDKYTDRPLARDRYEAARQLAASIGDGGRQAKAARSLGWMLHFLMAAPSAVDAFTEALEIPDGLSISDTADAMRGLGWARATAEGNRSVALELHREARRLLEEADDAALPNHYLVEANLLVQSGQPREALALADKAVALAQRGIGPLTWALEARSRAGEALGDRELLHRALDDGIDAARTLESLKGGPEDFMGREGWEGNFQERRAHDAMTHGEVDVARDAVDSALRVLDDVAVLNVHDAGVRGRLLVIRARLAEDDGDLELASELYRQAIFHLRGGWAVSHIEAMGAVGRLFADHGDLEAGRLAAIRAVEQVERLGGPSFYPKFDLAVMSDDIESALSHATEGLQVQAAESRRGDVGLLRRRGAALAERGLLDEALTAADEAVAAELSGIGSFLDRARIRIELGDAAGARVDLVEGASGAQIGWASDQLQLATTLARLALLEDRPDTAVSLWSAVQDYRAANKRLAPRLARRFEEPLVELGVVTESRAANSREALDVLRRLVAAEFEALIEQGGPTRP
ncbi:MAG TPA: hypothetical protein VMY88_02990 [Acidimicrobiales bacterium]|nr:hypothetical protein [Acidimicrobiales bacterium]